ncbi:MAG TPA: hypothetical protein VM012_05715 [Flavitalea sp.]|nr:hypothetical protein [Flavitalea sp.]
MKKTGIVLLAAIFFMSCGDYTSGDGRTGSDSASIDAKTGTKSDTSIIGSGGTGRIGTDTSQASQDSLRRKDSVPNK